jgi:N-acetylmuramoyl-L-alanine amidase
MLIGILVAVLIMVVIVALCVNQAPAKPGTTPTDPTAPKYTQLTVTSPAEQTLVSMEQSLVFAGTSDATQKLTIAGAEVVRDSDGAFTHTVQLQPGTNEITVAHKDQSITYTVEYRYAVQAFSPTEKTTYNCGATIELSLTVRQGSTLKVTLGSQEVAMQQSADQQGVAEGFVRYAGAYKLPTDNTQDLNLGKIAYTVTCNGVTESYYSADVICKKSADILASDPSVTPDYGNYIDVGSGYIAEIVNSTAETFNGATTDDYSDPRNNYLPKGTVDYCDKDLVTKGKNSYRLLRCGRRVYIEKPNYPPPGQTAAVVEVYRGTLPDHNEIGFVSMEVVKNHTVLTLDCLWKAPFWLEFGPQEYINPADRDFRVTRVTAEYVEITFCYATVFEGTVAVPAENPLFSSAQLTQNESDCVLRLNLKKTGGFYGWDAYYNDNDQLCFSFLNPAKATKAENAYGADLTGTLILLDVGHGGYDGGSAATLPDGTKVDEAELNLKLAMALKAELESTGATVVLNRNGDDSIAVDQRILNLKQTAPDLCVAVHQNSIGGYPDHRGGQVLYFTPFSQPAAQHIYEQTNATGIYPKTLLDWNLYYMARQAVCPLVLTENGFMTNAQDLADMMDDAVVQRKAEAIARGVANYFLSI